MDPAEIENRIRDPRFDYRAPPLDEHSLDADPIRQFLAWFGEASHAGVPEPNAMALCTVDPSGAPDARMVLLRGCTQEGFDFYSSSESAKGLQIAAGSQAALVFYWEAQHRQIRVRGTVKVLTNGEAVEYWDSRPRGSQVAARASRQSRVLESRQELEQEFARVEAEYEGKRVPPPADWTGYRVVPFAVELWQGREFRLHDRVRYRRDGPHWIRERLAP